MDVLHWVMENAEKLKVDPNRIILAGDSAGGNLCAGVAIQASIEKIQILCQILIYPTTTFSQDIISLDKDGDGLLPPGQVKRNLPTYSWIENSAGPFLHTQHVFWCESLYIKDEAYVQGELYSLNLIKCI